MAAFSAGRRGGGCRLRRRRSVLRGRAAAAVGDVLLSRRRRCLPCGPCARHWRLRPMPCALRAPALGAARPPDFDHDRFAAGRETGSDCDGVAAASADALTSACASAAARSSAQRRLPIGRRLRRLPVFRATCSAGAASLRGFGARRGSRRRSGSLSLIGLCRLAGAGVGVAPVVSAAAAGGSGGFGRRSMR